MFFLYMMVNILRRLAVRNSFEAALYLCEHLYGAAVARRLAGGLVIDWDLEEVPHLVVPERND